MATSYEVCATTLFFIGVIGAAHSYALYALSKQLDRVLEEIKKLQAARTEGER